MDIGGREQKPYHKLSISAMLSTLRKLTLLLILTALLTVFGGHMSANSRINVIPGTNIVLANTAQENVWQKLGGPIGGLGYDIRMRPDSPDIMYVTDAWTGVHMSTDGGKTWVASNKGIEARVGPSGDGIPVFSLTIDPNNNDVLWIGTESIKGIYHSVDEGLTWEKRVNGITENDGLTFRGFAVERGNSKIVYAAGEIASFQWAGQVFWGREFDRTKGVVYKSTDGGLNWQAIWRGDSLARYIIIDPNNTNIIYVSTGIFDREAANSDPATNKPGGVGIIKSADGGNTWQEVNKGLGNLYIGSLVMHPANSQVLLAGAGNNAYRNGGGIYLSTDGGANWQHVGGSHITSVEFAPGNPQIAYAASGEDKFYRSEDGGKTWRGYTRSDGGWGPEGIRPGFPIDLEVDPRNPMRIFVNNYGGGNFLSEDGGKTWITASDGYTGADLTDVFVNPTNPAIVYVNGRSGPFVSKDGGNTWVGLNTVGVAEGAKISIDPQNPNHILMSSAHWGWTYESNNGGLTWAERTNYFRELATMPNPVGNQKFQGMQAITFAPSNAEKVYAGFGLWRVATDADETLSHTPPIVSILTSEDGGKSWARHPGTTLDAFTVIEIVVHPLNKEMAWAGTVGGGIYHTSNGGSTWESRSNGLRDKTVISLAMDLTNPEILYAGTFKNGVFKSVNGGISWSASSIGMNPEEPVGALAINPQQPGTVYAGSWASGVFLSTDAGSSWKLINDGLRTRSIRALSISADGNTLYAATRGEGVFRLGDIPPEALAQAAQALTPEKEVIKPQPDKNEPVKPQPSTPIQPVPNVPVAPPQENQTKTTQETSVGKTALPMEIWLLTIGGLILLGIIAISVWRRRMK